jgi:pteridine reductase
MQENKVALITGSAKRVGACIAKRLHQSGMHIAIHYHHSEADAQQLCDHFNTVRAQSAITIQADLAHNYQLPQLITTTLKTWGRLDVLVNNAAAFDSTPLQTVEAKDWEAVLNSNLTAPFFLSLAAAPHLKKTRGCIINMVDIRGTQPLKHYTPYCISKAGLIMATKSLALEWAPEIRVNGIAPGVVLWPDETNATDQKIQEKIIARTPLKRAGTPEDAANAAYFLIEEAPYITGQVIAIDGGRSLAY